MQKYWQPSYLSCFKCLFDFSFTNQVESLKGRKFYHTNDALGGSSGDGITFSLMQYNVLGDEAIPRGTEGANRCGKYEYCPASHRYMDSE